MRKYLFGIVVLFMLLTGCQADETITDAQYKIGIVLSSSGLGDESFNDSAFMGLQKARDELKVLFDYREAPDENYESSLKELAQGDYNLIIGLGFSAQEALEKVAKEYPHKQFVLIDGQSDVKNILSVTFKPEESSFLVGMIAAMTSKSGKIGFIGGMDSPVINQFKNGFIEGAKHINSDIEIFSDYAGTFDDVTIGANIAEDFINRGADFIYPAAGFTGVGAIKTAEENNIYAAGVDVDQFYLAERTIVTSALKNVDDAIFQIVQKYIEKSAIDQNSYSFGLAENGVGLAEIRVLHLSKKQQEIITSTQKKLIAEKITIQAN